MQEYIRKRTLLVANYIITNKSTVRDTAKIFCTSKSTIFKDITDRLSEIDLNLRNKVKETIEYNKSERHIRGGKATKAKYKSHN